MNSDTSLPVTRRSAAATLLLAAALLLSACSTTAVSREPAVKSASTSDAGREAAEKPVTFAQLHGMLVKLASENALGGTATASIVDVGASGTLASNP